MDNKGHYYTNRGHNVNETTIDDTSDAFWDVVWTKGCTDFFDLMIVSRLTKHVRQHNMCAIERQPICGRRKVLLLMSSDEFKLLLILLFLFFTLSRFLRQDLRCILSVFSLSCTTGIIAQVLLGRALNLYTPNITLYVAYVSVAVVIAWGAGLTSIWAAHNWLARILRKSPGLGLHALCGIPILILLEATGSNIIRMKLHNYGQYAALMPQLNAMNAPKWLYVYYITVALIFFYSSRALGAYGKDWNGSILQNGRAIAACNDEGTD
jgi:hypothetical protein